MTTTDPPTLDGAGVLLTGATGGLGRALATELTRRGARVIGAGRDEQRLAELPVQATWAGDLRDAEAPRQVVAHALAELGTLHVVINAAGVVAFGPIAELDDEVAQALVEIDALVVMRLAAAALAALSPGGTFVNLTGIAGEQSIAGMAAYCGAKAAAASFMRAAAREARRSDRRVLDARPPHVETGLSSRPLAGVAPKLGAGLAPEAVATTICAAIEQGARDLPPEAFTAPETEETP